MATWPRTNQSPLASRRTAPPSGSVSSSISPTTSSMMSSTVTMPAVRPYSSMTTASDVRWRLRSASRSSSGFVSGTIGASRTRPSMSASRPVAHQPLGERVGVDDALHAVVVLVLRDHQARVAGGHAAAQGGLHVLRQVDGHDGGRRRHHLARLLLVQVEDAGEHAGLARVELAAGQRLLDEHLELLGRLALLQPARRLHAHHAEDRVGRAVEDDDERVEDAGEEVQRPRHEPRRALGGLDRPDLRDLLADRDVQRRS